MGNKQVSVQMLSTEYLNSYYHGNISKDDATKNISNLNIEIKDNKLNIMWNDCTDLYWKKNIIIKSMNQIPTNVFSDTILTTIDEKDKYCNTPLVDEDIDTNKLYCYRVFSEFSNSDQFYSGFKNVFFVYVYDESSMNSSQAVIEANRILLDPEHRFVTDEQINYWNQKANKTEVYTRDEINNLLLTNKAPLVSLTQNGLMSSNMLIKLNRLENYVHPTTHPVDMITGLAVVATTGEYNDLLNKPNLPLVSQAGQTGSYNDLKNLPALKPVATSGSYNDLVDKPIILEASQFARVAFTGSYVDLLNKPTISAVGLSGNFNDLINKPNIGNLSSVATSGDYNDLINKPSIPGMPQLATVATSGDYNDLRNKPNIAGSLNLADVAASGSYNDLLDKPIIPTLAKQISVEDTNNIITATNVEDALNELKISTNTLKNDLTLNQTNTNTLSKYVVFESGKGLIIKNDSNKLTIKNNGKLFYNNKLVSIGSISLNCNKVLSKNIAQNSFDKNSLVSCNSSKGILIIYTSNNGLTLNCCTLDSNNAFISIWNYNIDAPCHGDIQTIDTGNEATFKILVPMENGAIACFGINGNVLWKFCNSYDRNATGTITACSNNVTLTDNTKNWLTTEFKEDINNSGLLLVLNGAKYYIESLNGQTIKLKSTNTLPSNFSTLVGKQYNIIPADPQNGYFENCGSYYEINGKKLLFITGNDGSITQITITNNTYTLNWENSFGKKLISKPVMTKIGSTGYYIFCLDYTGCLYCLNSSGGLEWTTELDVATYSNMIAYDINSDSNDEVIICSNDGRAYIIDIISGDVTFTTRNVGGHLLCGPYANSKATSKMFALGQENKAISAYDKEADCLWSVQTEGNVTYSINGVTIGNEDIFVGGDSLGNIYIISSDGKIIKQLYLKGAINGTPNIIQTSSSTAKIVVGTLDGYIYAFDISQEIV